MFSIGDKIHCILSINTEYTIESHIGTGANCQIFKVSSPKKEFAFKWINVKPNPSTSSALYSNLYKNIKRNCLQGSPCDGFCWPIDITEFTEDGFGYLMPLVPDGYVLLSDILRGKTQLSLNKILRVAINIIVCLRSLGTNGLSGLDLHDGNILVNPEKGGILICDTDNVSIDGTFRYEYGPKRYLAPETIVNPHNRDLRSDRHSLLVLLFLLIFRIHPLEGRFASVPCFTDRLQDEVYGINPLFVFDPNDNNNALNPNEYRKNIEFWGAVPEYIRKLFITAFSQDALRNPNKRPSLIHCLKCFVRWESEIEKCPSCGEYSWSIASKEFVCPFCGSNNDSKFYLTIDDSVIPLSQGTRIRNCQVGTFDEVSCLKNYALIVCKPEAPEILGIKNCSTANWEAINGDKKKIVEPGKIIRILEGVVLRTPLLDLKIQKRVMASDKVENESCLINVSESISPRELPVIDDVIQNKKLTVFLVLDTSGNMKADMIGALNNAIPEMIEAFKGYKNSFDLDIDISVLEFNSAAHWICTPTPVHAFSWSNIVSGGLCDLGAALKELNLRLDHLLRDSNGCSTQSYYPIFIFLLAGYPTDNYLLALEKIQNKQWFMQGVKIAFAIGDDTDIEALTHITGTGEAIIDSNDFTAFKRLFCPVEISVTDLELLNQSTEWVRNSMVYSEVCAVLKLMDAEYVSRIPRVVLDFFEENRQEDYEPLLDCNVPLTEQNLRRDTIVYLAMLNIDYWCDSEDERTQLLVDLARNDGLSEDEIDIDKIKTEHKTLAEIINEEP